MTWAIAVASFLRGLWAGVRAARAAKAGGELLDGKKQVDGVDADVAAIEKEINDNKPATPSPE